MDVKDQESSKKNLSKSAALTHTQLEKKNFPSRGRSPI